VGLESLQGRFGRVDDDNLEPVGFEISDGALDSFVVRLFVERRVDCCLVGVGSFF